MCHGSKPMKDGASPVGDYLCDSPLELVESALQQMKKIEPNPDFIIWTGDDPPHVKQAELNQEDTLRVIKNVTDFITATFPNTVVFPALGNHDSYPAHQVSPVPGNFLFQAISQYWSHWLSADALKTLLHGGYYTMLVRPGFRIVSMNTVFYYHLDKQAVSETDPAGQFAWVRAVLTKARAAGEKVWIIGHVPPGFLEKTGGSNFHDHFIDPYLDTFSGFSDVVVCHLYGHEHTDSFRLYYENNTSTTATSVMFMAPSVTPWFNAFYTTSIPNNPGLRLYDYDPKTVQIMDYYQYWSNLTHNIAQGSISWDLEYVATQEYDLTSPLTPTVMQELFNRIKTNETLFEQYLFYNSVSYPSVCTGQCRLWQLCAMEYPDLERYKKCLNGPTSA